nr:reverse transcriptase domain-containing protein [Tanacetum cinerariifolium]
MAKQHNELKNMMSSFLQMQSPSGSGSISSNTIANPRGDLKAITTRSGVAYDGPTIPPTYSPLQKVVKRETETTKEKVQATSSESTAHVQPPVVQVPIPEPDVAPKPNPKSSIPYPSRLKLEECLALADLGTRINLMPLSIWKKLSLSELTPTLDYDVDPRVPLILERPFLRTTRALIDVHNKELTLRVNDEAIAFKVGHTSRYSRSDFILEEIETFLRTPDELSNMDDDYYDTEGDILYLEKLLNEDPSPNLPPMKNEDIKQVDATMMKSSIEEPPELELKDLPSHLEYAFLEGTDKLLIIISMELKDEEKASLLKILIEDDFKPAVQHQRRVNPKIHEVIKKEGIKLLDAGLIYPIFDSPYMMAIFHDMIEETIEVFMDDFSVFGDSFSLCLSHLDKMLKRIKVDRAKVNVIAKLPHPTSVKGAENLAADHLSRLENPHEGDLKKKEINETFPLRTLGIISSHNDSSTRVMAKYGVTHRLSTTYHPQTSGQVEVTNRGLKRILERTVGENRALWSDKLEDALWAFRTAYKTSIDCTPYRLVYGKACHLPYEIEHKAYWALKHTNFDLRTVGDHRKLQLNKLSELRDQAYENSLIYKERTKKLHDDKIKNRIFNVGDQVLLFNSRLKIFSGKLKSRWSSSFTIFEIYPYGTAKLIHPDGCNFKVNCHRLKHYHGGDLPPLEIPDISCAGYCPSFQDLCILSSLGMSVAVDYLSKWVEAKALPTNDARVVVKILKYLFARFGTPRAIISDRGTHFCNDQFEKVMLKYGVTHRLSTAYHPQMSGEVEVSNHGLKRILERTVEIPYGESKVHIEVLSVLWGNRLPILDGSLPLSRDPESLIRRRNLGDPPSLFDFEEVMSIPYINQGPPPAGPPPHQNNNGPPPVVRPNGPAPRSMEELCQPSIHGRGGPIAPIPIQATDFGLRHHMIQQV